MASCIYNHFILEGDVCSRLGLCKKAAIFTPRDWTCEECTDVLARTAAFMSEEETIAMGVEYLQGDCFCGADGHTADYADLVSAIFTPRDWTCEECTDVLARTAAFMSEEETIAMGVEYLKGDCFCGADGHTADCGDLVSAVVPLAMPVLAQTLVEQTVEL